ILEDRLIVDVPVGGLALGLGLGLRRDGESALEAPGGVLAEDRILPRAAGDRAGHQDPPSQRAGAVRRMASSSPRPPSGPSGFAAAAPETGRRKATPHAREIATVTQRRSIVASAPPERPTAG